MGVTTIYWQPMGQGPVQTVEVDFLTGLDVQMEAEAATTVTLGGAVQRTISGQRWTVRAERSSISELDSGSATMLRKLRALEAHLQAGYSVALAHDGAPAAVHFSANPGRQGATTVNRGGNAAAFLGGSGGLAIGSTVIVESLALPRTWERGTLSAASPAFVLTDALLYAHALPVVVRSPDFWPSLKLREAGPILVPSGPNVLDLELELVEDLPEVLALQGGGIQLGTQTASGASLGARAHLASVAAITAPDWRP